jgi:hypothetical protein
MTGFREAIELWEAGIFRRGRSRHAARVRRTGRGIEHGSYLLQKAKSRTKAAALSHHLDHTRGCGYAGEIPLVGNGNCHQLSTARVPHLECVDDQRSSSVLKIKREAILYANSVKDLVPLRLERRFKLVSDI